MGEHLCETSSNFIDEDDDVVGDVDDGDVQMASDAAADDDDARHGVAMYDGAEVAACDEAAVDAVDAAAVGDGDGDGDDDEG